MQSKGPCYSLNQKENVLIFRFIESDLNFGLEHLTWKGQQKYKWEKGWKKRHKNKTEQKKGDIRS